MEHTAKLPKIGEILSVSLEASKQHAAVYMRILLPYLILTVLQSIASLYSALNAWMAALTVALILAVIAYSVYMGIVLTRISYQAVMTGKVDESKARENIWPIVWPLLAVGIITGLAISFGTLLLIVPGIILWLMYFSAQYLVIIDGKGIGESLRTSIALSKGRKGDLFVKACVSYLVVGIVYGFAIGITGGIFGSIGALISENVAVILLSIGTSLVALPFIPVFANIATFIYGHLKRLRKTS